MSIGLLVDMAFWTFKTIISFFFLVLCFSTENSVKKKKSSIPFWHSVCSQLIFYSKAPKIHFCIFKKIDCLSIVTPQIISFVPPFSSSLIMWSLHGPWELRIVMVEWSKNVLGKCWPAPNQQTAHFPLKTLLFSNLAERVCEWRRQDTM